MPDTNSKVTRYYESVEFTLADATTDSDLDGTQPDFLAVFGPDNAAGSFASRVMIRTDNTITIKINGTSNNAITVTSTDSPVTIQDVELQNLFISNSSGSNAAIKLLFTV